MQTVAALFVRADSVYKTLAGVDCYDAERDARTWPGGCPVVAHPPCRTWGTLKAWARAPVDEHGLAIWAVEQVRRYGGVLEHPSTSGLWREMQLPKPNWLPDAWGGMMIEIDQFHWGHLARKRTWLYIVGVSLADLPTIPHRDGVPTHCVSSLAGRRMTRFQRVSLPTRKPELGPNRRDKTPPDFARWLVELARRTRTRG
jgi:hypothetical protein